MRKLPFTLFIALLLFGSTYGQYDIHSKEGRVMMNRKQLVYMCLNSLKKPKSDTAALAICECQADKIDGRFTNSQYRRHSKSGFIDLNAMIKEDSLVAKEFKMCFTNSDKTFLFTVESAEDGFLPNCMNAIFSSTERKLDSNQVRKFCECQLQLIRSKKLTDTELEELRNPNSILYFEVTYKCGDPLAVNEHIQRNWTVNSKADIRGPAADTVNVLTLNGMTYVKLKIGNNISVWLFDTGASDMLVNTQLEADLRTQNIINDHNYLGTVEYEMANGAIDTCRRYRINGVQIGEFTVDNVIIAVTNKGKRLILGKTLLNKFGWWILDNKQNKLILSN